MPAFTNESEVRARYDLNDATLVPAALIETAIADAHEELLRYLNPAFDVEEPEAVIVIGETLLAGAHLFRTLAAKQAFAGKRLTVGGQRIEEGTRFDTLMAVAASSEAQAWYILEPCLIAVPPRTAARATDTIPVLGED